MNHKLLSLAVVPVLMASLAGPVWGEDDSRVIGKFDQSGAHDPLRVVSIYLTFHGDKADGLPGLAAGDESRFYTKVWDDLFLQVTTETGENGVAGYMFAFSKDMEDQKSLAAIEPKDSATLREVSAGDFRTSDNFEPRPLKAGPGTPKDRGPFRILHYDAFDAEIRVLEFNIGDAKLGKKPFFKSFSCLVTLREKAPIKQDK